MRKLDPLFSKGCRCWWGPRLLAALLGDGACLAHANEGVELPRPYERVFV